MNDRHAKRSRCKIAQGPMHPGECGGVRDLSLVLLRIVHYDDFAGSDN